jgi:hypothetical protein
MRSRVDEPPRVTIDVDNWAQRQYDSSCWHLYSEDRVLGWYTTLPVWFSFCQGCGALFTARTADQSHCSTDCGPMPEGYARELRRLAVTAGPRIDRLDIFSRDGWTCYLCGKAVARHPKDPLSRASLDHVIPIIHGGHHSPDNVRTTHLRCNLRKADAFFTEEQVAHLAAYLESTAEEAPPNTSRPPSDAEWAQG